MLLTEMPYRQGHGGSIRHHTDLGRRSVRVPPRGDIRLPRRKHPDRRQGILHALGSGKGTCQPPADLFLRLPSTLKSPKRRGPLASGAELFIGGHGGAAKADAVQFKIDYLKTV